jgi:hypothetical protein
LITATTGRGILGNLILASGGLAASSARISCFGADRKGLLSAFCNRFSQASVLSALKPPQRIVRAGSVLLDCADDARVTVL